MNMKDLVQNTRTLLGIQLTPSQISALHIYEDELIKWNAVHNLTAIDSPAQIRTKHFLDSFTCMLAMRDSCMQRVIDVGTGAGFPGIPLKILRPDIHLTLVESVGKKAQFCINLVRMLELEGLEVIQARAEEVGQEPFYRERFNWALARAVAAMPVLAEYLLPLVEIGGSMLAMKGETAPAETHSAESAIRLMGGHLHKLIPVILPGVTDERYLVLVSKIAATPKNYPRRVGIPAKRPVT